MGIQTTNPDGKNQISEAYESIEFSVNTAVTDYDVDSQQATFKAVVANPYYLELYTSQNISIKFNSTANHAITIASTESPRIFDRQVIKNLYISNSSGSTANIKLYVK